MRDMNLVQPSVRAYGVAGRLFVPVLIVMALALAYTMATSVVGGIRNTVAAAVAADTTGLVR